MIAISHTLIWWAVAYVSILSYTVVWWAVACVSILSYSHLIGGSLC